MDEQAIKQAEAYLYGLEGRVLCRMAEERDYYRWNFTLLNDFKAVDWLLQAAREEEIAAWAENAKES